MKGKVLAITLILMVLVAVLLTETRLINMAYANFFPEPVPQGIHIESDGSVNGTDKIQRNGDTYTFTGNIYSTLVVLCDNIIIDGAGYSLQGKGDSTGIFLQDRVNVTIKNMKISNFSCGIKLPLGSIEAGSRRNTISGNTITGNDVGIQFSLFTGNNFVYNNVIANNSYGIKIFHSTNNIFRNNRLERNRFNLWVAIETSVQAAYYVNSIDTSNTVDGKPVYYWVNQHDKTVPSDAGYVALISCNRITVQNLNLANNGQGVLLIGTNNSLITKNRITSSYYGIALYGPYEPCTNNTITDNEIIASTKEAIYVWSDHPNNIYDNIITAAPETTPPSASPWQSASISQSPITTPSNTGAEPSMTWAAVAFASATILILGLLLYFKKRKH
ncbi:MAG: NosD domain-containing protein [Candidatus Bathyarchaeia archaeon]